MNLFNRSVKLFLRYTDIYLPFSNAFYLVCVDPQCACAPCRVLWKGVVMVTTIFFPFCKIIFNVNISNQSLCKVSNNTHFVKLN